MIRALMSLFALCLAGCFTTVNLPAPERPLPIAAGAFPHAVLDRLQARWVDQDGRVDYQGVSRDRAELELYLAAVAEASPRSAPELFPTKEERLAYWINAYNAWVLWAVIGRPRMRSLADEKTDFFYFTKYVFGGEAWNLYKLENEVIRPEFEEPRVHMAVNCATFGCARLPREAFQPARLEEQLAREATRFCADSSQVRIRGTAVELSQIFEWYHGDFEADGGPIGFCRKWGRSDLPDRAKLSFIPYDWALNAQPGRALFDPPAPVVTSTAG